MVDVCDLVDGDLVPSHTDDLREVATEHETTPAASYLLVWSTCKGAGHDMPQRRCTRRLEYSAIYNGLPADGRRHDAAQDGRGLAMLLGGGGRPGARRRSGSRLACLMHRGVTRCLNPARLVVATGKPPNSYSRRLPRFLLCRALSGTATSSAACNSPRSRYQVLELLPGRPASG